jgi:carboxylesterase type B
MKYLGIPYAKAKRFENPTDPDSWNTTRNATAFGKHCPQPTKDPKKPLGNLADTSEDCLFVNVFAPNKQGVNSSGLAVMLWIHGGAYAFGSGGSSNFDGGVLASEEGVIVVTINYRVGALGFLSTGNGTDLKGNYGMLDQVHAMKWVKKNIKR